MGILLRSFVATLLAFAVLAGVLLATGDDEPSESSDAPQTGAPPTNATRDAGGEAAGQAGASSDAPQANATRPAAPG